MTKIEVIDVASEQRQVYRPSLLARLLFMYIAQLAGQLLTQLVTQLVTLLAA